MNFRTVSLILSNRLICHHYNRPLYNRSIMADQKPAGGIVSAILISNGVSVLLFILRVIGTSNSTYWFMFWNLFLAWVPLGFAWILNRELKTKSWRQPLPVGLTLLWLLFLPNSFYMISDLVHLQSTGDIGILFDVVLFMSFIWNGILGGFLSMGIIHRALVRRTERLNAHLLMSGVVLINSFAIYLGRTLRWNSWDVVANPGGLLFDVSERVINPLGHPQAFVTTATFFLLLGSIYLVAWQLANNKPR